jgi:CRP/FNR family transcriptional regulator, cyclic AMP receptor protein
VLRRRHTGARGGIGAIGGRVLVSWDLLRSLGEDERRQVLASARRRRFRRREVLFHRGDPGDAVHLIASGTVAVYVTTPVGSTAIFGLFGPGEAIGEMALVEGGERTATAIAMEPAETLSLRRDQFEELRRRHPAIDRMLVDLLAARVRRQNADLVDAYFAGAEDRVARRLAEISGRLPETAGRRTVHITQEDLAALAGTTRPTANRVLRELERAGALTLGRGRIEVLDLDRLIARGR